MNQTYDPQLFAGSRYHPQLHKAIGTDIRNLCSNFPGLTPYAASKSPDYTILIQGLIPVTIQMTPVQLPINMSLPPRFPDEGPIIGIPRSSRFPFVESQYLTQGGTIKWNFFTQWIPRRTTLPIFMLAISQAFSNNHCFNLSQAQSLQDEFRFLAPGRAGPPGQGYGAAPAQRYVPPPTVSQQLIEQTTQDALKTIANYNNQLQKTTNAKIRLEEQKHHEKILEDGDKALSDNIVELEKQAFALENRKVPEYAVSQTLNETADIAAKNESYQDIVHDLTVKYMEKKVPLDMFIKLLRELARDHFEEVISKQCRS